MWLFTTFGFFSIVRKEDDAHLTIRGRTLGDLQRLRRHYLPMAGEPSAHGGSDYPWRMRCTQEDLAAAMARIVEHVDYANFKDEVERCIGAKRHDRYAKVWSALYGMSEDLAEPAPDGWDGLPWPAPACGGKAPAFGGVVVDQHGWLLLRETAGHWDDYVWTFAKGRPDKGESPRQAALREVREEMGVEARILYPLAGIFAGGTTVNHYFLMTVERQHVDVNFSCRETARLCWALPKDAPALIAQTKNPKGRARDLKVLEAAVAALPGPIPLERPIARLDSWKLRPMPVQRKVLPYERTFFPAEMARLSQGFVPTEMEEKWCIYLEDSILRFHRSWTGFEIYRVRLAPLEHKAGHWAVAKVEVNRHAGQYLQTDAAEDCALLDRLIDGLLLSPVPPMEESHGDD